MLHLTQQEKDLLAVAFANLRKSYRESRILDQANINLAVNTVFSLEEKIEKAMES